MLPAIPVDEVYVPCRFGCKSHAVGRYETPQGCACFTDDRVQDLCGQHVIKGGMLGEARLVKIYDRVFYELTKAAKGIVKLHQMPDALDEYRQAREALEKSAAAVQKLAEPAKKAALIKRKKLREQLAEVDRELRSLNRRPRKVPGKKLPAKRLSEPQPASVSQDTPEARRLYQKLAFRRVNLKKWPADSKKAKAIGDEIYRLECALEDLGLPKEAAASARA